MEEPTLHALHCQPSTSGQQPLIVQRDSDSPISPSGSNGSKNTTTNSSSASPMPQQIFPTRSPSLQTSSQTSSVRKFFGKTVAPLSAKATLLPPVGVQCPPQQRLVQVHSLTKETLSVAVEQKCQVWDVYHCCCSHLGIDDPRFLGLAIRAPSEGIGTDRPRHEYFFLQNDQKVAKYLPKQSRFSKTSSAEKCRPVLVLYLRVKIFVERIDMINCPVALHHYYLQLRENLLDQWSGANSVREERCWELATLAVQADESGQGTPNQFRAETYFPLWVINLRGYDYIRKNMPKVCRSAEIRITPKDSKMQFCQEASRSPFALNCHLYGLRRHKADMIDNALIGITDKGIDMWDVGTDGERIPLRSLPWNKMVRLTFDHKKLTIGGVDNSKMSLFAQSDEKARYLLNFCKDVHQQLIQINLHFALTLKQNVYSNFPPGWGNEVCVDNGRINRLSTLPPIQAPSPLPVNSTTTSTQPSPTTNIQRGPSPHPLMRIHQQHSIEETEMPEFDVPSVKERTASDTSSVPTIQEQPKKKRSSGNAKAKIGTNLPPTINTKPGRYEPHNPNSRISRVSPSYSSSGEVSAASSATPADLEILLNTAASPPRYQITDEDLSFVAPMPVVTSNGTIVPQSGTVQSTVQHFEAGNNISERRSHFMNSRTFDDYAPQTMAAMEPASRSMHDLRYHQNVPQNVQAFRPPPNYHFALQQHIENSMLQQQRQQQYIPSNVPNMMVPQQKQPRWQTVGGIDPEMKRLLDKISEQQQQFMLETQPTYSSMTASQMEQQQEQFAVHRGVSEPRLNMNVNHNLYANIPVKTAQPVQQQPQKSVPAVNDKKPRRYTSRSPSNRGINRVKSMPNQTGVLANEINRRYPPPPPSEDPIQNQNQRPVHFQKQPPPYDQALQMQREANRKNILEKRHSTSGIALDQVKNFPMLQALVQENGGLPSTSASEDTSTTSSLSQMGQNRDFDHSSIDSQTPPLEYLQRETSGRFSDHYAVTPQRYNNLIQQTINHSPPSPPFHYANAPGILWNGSGTFIRGEYLFQDGNNVLAEPYGYYGYPSVNGPVNSVQTSDIRPNGIFKESEIVDLPAPPRYKSSLVM